MINKKIVKTFKRNPGDKKTFLKEKKENLGFNIIKLNNRPKPNDTKEILVISCFSEFGCESVGALYCIPRILKDYPSKYKIIVGWYGREYLYKHLADEFWELKPEHMWLREYSRAFHHDSYNLKKLEESLSDYGILVPSSYLGRIAISAKCLDCKLFYNTVYQTSRYEKKICLRCNSSNVIPPVLGDVSYWKQKAVKIPHPEKTKIESIKKYLGKNPVGIFARSRKCYGRNLQPEFYIKLIELLRSMNYEPVWLGEKVSTSPCPVSDVVDFSRMKESRDLELTLAIITQCKFTVQFWTASSRFAGLMGIPYLLFESPDQIWGQGQEGIRRNLCDFGPRKLSINHYLNIYNDNDKGIEIIKRCIKEMEESNYEDHIGLVEEEVVNRMRSENKLRIGDKSD